MTEKTTPTPEDEFAAAFSEAAAARKGEAKPSEPEPASETPAQEVASSAADEPPGAAAEPTLEQQLEQLRRERDEALHRERSASARVSAFHKKLNATTAELESLRGRAAEPKAPQPAAVDEDAELQEALSEMPEIAKLVDRLVERKVSQSVKQVKEEVDQAVEPLRKRAEQDELQTEIAVVEKEFPDWRNTVFSDDWDSWIASKPPVIQQAYSQAKTAADALEFLRMYRSEKGEKPAAAPAAEPRQAPQARLANAVGIPSRQVPPARSAAPASDDFEGAFEFFASQRRKTA